MFANCALAVSAVVLVASAHPQAGRVSEAKRHVDKAALRLKKMDFRGALAELALAKKASAGPEDEVQVSLYTGLVMGYTGRDDEARAAFREALRLDANVRLPANTSAEVAALFAEEKKAPRPRATASLEMPPPPGMGLPPGAKAGPSAKVAATEQPVLPPPPPPAPKEPPMAEKPPPPPPVVATPKPVVDTKASVAVLDVAVTVPNEKLDGAAFSEMLVTALDQPKLFKVISSKDITSILGVERQRQMAGCGDESCMAEIASALGADFVMEASVGRVGQNYLVSGRLIDAARGKVKARASVQAKDANLLLEAVWRMAQQMMDAYGAGLAQPEATKWASRERKLPASAVVQEAPSSGVFGAAMLAVVGYQPLSVKGERGTVGGEVDLTFRTGALDVGAGVVVARDPGARVSIGYAIFEVPLRVSLGVRGTAFPGVSTYGGGPAAVVEWPLGSVFAVNGTVAGEFYPVSGGVIVALLGGAGVAAHF